MNRNFNIPRGVQPPPDLQQAIDEGIPINLNCDRVNGCPTLLPPSRTTTPSTRAAQTSTTTPSTTRAPGIRISIQPLINRFHRPVQTEEIIGTETVSRDEDIEVDETDELPIPGLGDDFINEVYRLEPTESSVEEGKEKKVSKPLFSGQSNVGTISKPQILEQSKEDTKDFSTRVASVPRESLTPQNRPESSEDIKDVVSALRGLIQLLNSTEQGRKRLQKIKQKLYLTPRPGGYTSKDGVKVHDIILGNAIPKTHYLKQSFGTSVALPHLEENTQEQQTNWHGDNQIIGDVQQNNRSSLFRTPTIPPHLIPLGPDGRPLVRPDGSFVDQPNVLGSQNQLAEIFPHLATIDLTSLDTTTQDPVDSTSNTTVSTTSETENENKDIVTTMIDSVRNMPMETKRFMLANMMFGVPMAAITMAAAGVPHLAIAPLATLIPGFLFTAFTDTTAPDSGGHGHGHGHAPAREGGTHGHTPAREGGTPPRRGLAGLISGLQNFYAHRRENQTLHIHT